MDELTPIYRVEFFLDAIVNDSENPYSPIHRIEYYLAKIAGEDVEIPTPIYRIEYYLAKIAGEDVEIPSPIYRAEFYLAALCGEEVVVPEPLFRIEYWLAEWVEQSGGIEKTIIGNPIHITDALAKPVQALSVKLEPVQDLHGYDNPWPSGGGKNKYDYDTDWPYKTSRHTYGSNVSSVVTLLNSLPEGTYTIVAKIRIDSVDTLTTGDREYGFWTNGRVVDGVKIIPTPSVGSVVTIGKSFTISAAQVGTFTSCYWYAGKGGSNTDMATIYDVGVNVGNDENYYPYSNICPIRGHTDADVVRTGKNLLKLVESEMVTSGWNRLFPISLKAGTYIISCQNQFGDETNKGCATAFVDADVQVVKQLSTGYLFGDTEFVGYAVTVSEEEADRITHIRFSFRAAGVTFSKITVGNIQLELGSTATAYSPYVGTTYPIPLGQTVYGGTLDAVTGVLTVDRVGFVSTSDNLNGLEENTSASTNDWLVVRNSNAFPNTDGNKRANSICSHTKYKFANVDGTAHYYITTNGFLMVVPKSAYPTFADFTSTLTGNDILTCVAYIATPTTIQLTPQQVELLLGENNIWSDGTMTLVYLADGNASEIEALNILLGGRYVNNHGEDEPSDREALDILLGR